jgi:hypothetical protein
MGRRDDKRKVWVVPFNGSSLKYGFATNVDTAQGTQLGHANVTGQALAGLIYGANAPKPARASKRFATGTVSSFINAGNVANARTQGWRIGKARIRRGGSTAKAKVVYVTINGVKYAWSLPNDTAAAIGSLQALGIRLATNSDTDLVFGATSPKPPQVFKVVGNDVISTYCDPSVTLPAGWSTGAEKIDPLQGP